MQHDALRFTRLGMPYRLSQEVAGAIENGPGAEAFDLAQEAKDEAEQALSGPYLQFASRSAAIATEIPAPVAVISVAGLQYVSDAAGTAMETVDGRKWSPGGEVWPHHFGDMTGNNCQVAINAAIDWLAAKGGGDLSIPGGTYVCNGKIVLKSNVHLIGKGRPVLQLLSNSNCTMIESESYLALSGTGEAAGADESFSIRNFRLECQRAFNLSPPANEGHGIAVYGRDFLIENVYVRNARRMGIVTEYAVGPLRGVSPYNCRLDKITTANSGETGLKTGVSDAHITNVNVISAGAHDDGDGHSHIWFGPSGNARCVNIQCWCFGASTSYPDYAVRIDTPAVQIHGGMWADAKLAQLFLNNNACSIESVETGPPRGIGGVRNARHAIIAGVRNSVHLEVKWDSPQTPPSAVQFGTVENPARSNTVEIITDIRAQEALVEFVNTTGFNKLTAIGYCPDVEPVSGEMLPTDIVDVSRVDGILTKHMTHERLATGSTSDDTPTNLVTLPSFSLPLGTTWAVEALVVGREYGTGNGRYAAKLFGTVTRAPETATIVGTPTVDVINAAGGATATLVASGNDYAIQVTGLPTGTIRWTADIRAVGAST